jgi:hypothetical protein
LASPPPPPQAKLVELTLGKKTQNFPNSMLKKSQNLFKNTVGLTFTFLTSYLISEKVE